MDIFQKIIAWNESRGLLARGFNLETEIANIAEELLESTGKHDSESARAEAIDFAQKISKESKPSPEEIVDAFADIIVYATGSIAKSGYNPSLVMEEVYKEINSRTGKLIDGKFVKDLDSVKYKADFSKCTK